MDVYKKLLAVQAELKAPKGQYNSFGKYKYRSCEDILEAVKPILAKHGATLVVGDELLVVGERYYIKAVATFMDAETGDKVANTAYAREEESKKGMDGSQITGTASSYARKYCLNGLFLIDDTKDADTDAFTELQKKGEKKAEPLVEKKREVTYDDGYVRCINGRDMQVKSKDGKWHHIEELSEAHLKVLLQKAEYKEAWSAIEATLAAMSI